MEFGAIVARLLPVLGALVLAVLVESIAFRQHPIEGVLRFSFIAATAWLLGAPPVAIATYRLLGALNSVLEHANICVPVWLDRILVYVWVTPDMHKVHHSRARPETDSNYANLFSFFDRFCGTFTPSARGRSVEYGIEGYDAAEHHSIGAVLALPFRRIRPIPAVGPVTLDSFPTAAQPSVADIAGEQHGRRIET